MRCPTLRFCEGKKKIQDSLYLALRIILCLNSFLFWHSLKPGMDRTVWDIIHSIGYSLPQEPGMVLRARSALSEGANSLL